MWSQNTENRNRRMVAVTNAGYYVPEHINVRKTKGTKKMSSVMAVFLGAILAIEIMIAGGMILNIDFYHADVITLILSFIVLFSGVVAVLADK